MLKLFLLCILGYFVTGSQGIPTVAFITACEPEDEACLLSSATAALPHLAAGVPDLDVPPVDPLVLEDVNGDQGELKLQFKNMRVAGPGQCKFLRMSVGPSKSHLEFDAELPITATGQYKVGGKLLVVPIEGEGDFEIKTNKIKLFVKASLSETNGHYQISDVEYSYEPQEQLFFRLDNLFNGNEEKSKPVIEILNHSWKEVLDTIGKPIIDEIVHQAKEHINQFLGKIPAEEVFLA